MSINIGTLIAAALPSIVGIVRFITGAIILQEHDASRMSMTVRHRESSAYSQQDATVIVAPAVLVHVPYLSRHGSVFVGGEKSFDAICLFLRILPEMCVSC